MAKEKKKKTTWERDGDTRLGWIRFTNYIREDNLRWLKTYADNNGYFLMDLLDDVITKFRNRSSNK